MTLKIDLILSGGQTGADRGALDAAEELGVPRAGWCPKGRKSEDGVIPERYNFLTETESPHYKVRTDLNVRDSDGTLMFYFSSKGIGAGTGYTIKCCRNRQKPYLLINLDIPNVSLELQNVRGWIEKHGISELNVAGSRESKCAGMHAAVKQFMIDLLQSAA